MSADHVFLSHSYISRVDYNKHQALPHSTLEVLHVGEKYKVLGGEGFFFSARIPNFQTVNRNIIEGRITRTSLFPVRA